MDAKTILLTILTFSMIGLGGALYSTYDHYNTQVQTLNTKLSQSQAQINALSDQLFVSDQFSQVIATNLSRLKDKQKEDVATINGNVNALEQSTTDKFTSVQSMIQEIEEQSNIELDELKSDLARVQTSNTDFSGIADDVVESVVSVVTEDGSGSGAYIDDRGFVVTNYHVVESASQIIVQFSDDSAFTGQLIGFDEVVDIAIIRTIENKQELKWGDSDSVKVGEQVIAVGNPIGLSFTVTQGIVSAVKREGTNNLPVYIQTDVPINPGNSGGPLVGSNGRIIGINNFKLSGFEGLGFSLESDTAKAVTEDIINKFLDQS